MGWSGGGLVGGLLGIQSIRKRLEKERERDGRGRWALRPEKERETLHTHALEEINPDQNSCVSSFSTAR